ncbi:MAG: tetratricopeptide repeat protein [Bacteroidaceae bacterium]|nr:tetratricopeptide repeat protein [Bacteroidaceae bacterium]
MKKLVFTMTLLLSAAIAFGQALSKEELKAQKKQIKALMVEAKSAEKLILDNPDAALAKISTCTENPLVNGDAYVWYIKTQALKAIIDRDNASRASGGQIDMNKLYSNCVQLISELEICDSLDNLPDKKGKVAPKYTEFIKTALYENRNQMYNGGSYFYNQKKYAEAFSQFDKFVELSEHKYLAELIQPAEKVYNVGAAYNAILCGMQLEDYSKVLKYADYAAQDETKASTIYRYKATAYSAMGDTVKWVDLLKEGVVKYPKDPFFYQTLISYYDNSGKRDELNALADELMASDPSNPLFVYLKGYIAQQQNDYETAITWYKKTLEMDPNYVDAHTNLGRAYIAQAQEYSASQSSTKIDRAKMKKDKEVLNGLFSAALPHFEKLRELVPEDKSLWLNSLTNCYYNLNMIDKMKELEKLAE